MTGAAKDGGAAFPQFRREFKPDPLGGSYVVGLVEGGMSLRDWFAGQALAAVIAATSAGQHRPGEPNDERPLLLRMACDAYLLADAMLAARTGGAP